MSRTITICFTNNKGGSGKSTTCSNVGAAMAQAGKKVLLIDGDMQLNLSLSFFPEEWVLEQAAGEKNLYHAIGKQQDLTDYIVHTPYENLDLIPSSTLMSSIEYELFTKWQREFILKKCLQKVKDSGKYDYILIDCPPSLGLLTINALTAANSVLIPIQCEYYALEGVTSLMDTVARIKRGLNASLDIEGVLLTMLDGRTNLGLQVVAQVKKHFRGKVFATIVPRNVRLGEAPSHALPINRYDPRSTGAEAYRALAREVMARNGDKPAR